MTAFNRILVVENSGANQWRWLDAIEDLAANELCLVNSLSACLSKLDEGSFDLGIVDPVLSDCEGIEAVRAIRAAAPALPLIICCSEEFQDLALECTLSSGEIFLIKETITKNSLRQAAAYAIRARKISSIERQEYLDARRAQAQFAAALHCMGDGFCQVDMQNRLTYLNPTALSMLGYTLQEACGHKLHQLLHFKFPDGTFRPAETCPLVIAFREGRSYHSDDDYFIRKDGSFVWIEYSTAPLVVDGETIGGVICFRDITGRKEAERRVNEFYSTISHELRTPLTSIRGGLSVIEAGLCGEISPEVAEIISLANTNCERLTRLINDILDLRKIEAGGLELRIERADPLRLVQRTLEDLSLLAQQSNIKLSLYSTFSHQETIEVDVDRIIQVLTNLVGNAIKFSPPGGEVCVKLECTEHEHIRFNIVDHGPGVAKADLHKLFEKFQQVDQSDTRQKEGTGLGLAISKAIVEQHKGVIGVTTESGKGSCFWFELPKWASDILCHLDGLCPAECCVEPGPASLQVISN